MKAILLSLLVLVFFTSCNEKKQADEPQTLTVSEFILKADQLDSTIVNVIGKVDHICMGSRAKIHFVCPEHSGESIKIFANDEIKEFNDTLLGKVVMVTGMVSVSTKIDNAYLDEWEAELMKEEVEGEEHQDEDAVEEDHHHAAVEGETEAHQHAEGTEEPETHHHDNQMALIAKYRKQIEDSGKGYINLYKIVVSKVSPTPLPE